MVFSFRYYPERPMKTFHCTHCQNLIFFENVRCLSCDHSLAFLPDQKTMGALIQSGDESWKPDTPAYQGPGYRLCKNHDTASVCNWAVPVDDPQTLCGS